MSIHADLHRQQSGAVLFMVVVFLLLLTVMATTTFTVSKGTNLVIANATIRNQVAQTAWQVSEQAISTTRLVDNPNNVLFNGNTFGNSTSVDINGDGKTVIQAAVSAPKCNAAKQVSTNNLNLAILRDLACANSAQITQFCYDVTFQFSTTATDSLTNSISTITQGASVRAQPGPARNICHGSGGQLYF